MYSTFRNFLLKNADQNISGSVSDKLRKKRHELFLMFCSSFEKPVKIIDLGGSDYFWKNLYGIDLKDFDLTILNKEIQKPCKEIKFINHDAKDLSFIKDKEYDVVFSNSLIEHIIGNENRKKLANEIMRIGKKFFIQTPNYYFPVEPHFLFPFFQFLPEGIKINLSLKHDLGWFQKQQNRKNARELVSSIRLLKLSELRELFPGSKIIKEKYFLLNKSFIIHN